MKPLYFRFVCLLLAVATIACSGCRAIRRIGDSRQSIAARRLSGQGFQAMHDGQWEIAETLFADALDVSKSDDRAHWGLAEAYWKRGERELAVQQMEQAVRLSADDPAFVQRLGRMYLEIGRLPEADTHSQSALHSERDSPAAWALRGDCLKAAGKHDKALAAYHRALALQPDYPEVQIQSAEIYRTQERYDRLLATLDRLQDGTGVDNAPARVDILKGIAMRQLGRGEEAEQCFVRATRKDPNNSAPLLELASLAMEGGDVSAAHQSLAAALQLNPSTALTDPWMKEAQIGDPLMSETQDVEQRLAREPEHSSGVQQRR
jgi:Tfp pilus assembly protein PilF